MINIPLLQKKTQAMNVDTPLVIDKLKKAGISTTLQKVYAKNIKIECKERIQELKAENKNILPKKISQRRLTLLGVASLISVIAGIILGVVGIGLSASGVGLPLGLALLGLGIVSIAIGVPCLKYFNKRANQDKAVKRNLKNIQLLKKIIHDKSFRKFAISLRNELHADHLSPPAFALKYDLTKIFQAYSLHEQEKQRKVQRRDPLDLSYDDYTAYLDLLTEKIRLNNQILREIDTAIRKINSAIIKSAKKDYAEVPLLHGCRKVFLRRAANLKAARIDLLRDVPDEHKLHYRARKRFQFIKRLSKQRFIFLDSSLAKKTNW